MERPAGQIVNKLTVGALLLIVGACTVDRYRSKFEPSPDYPLNSPSGVFETSPNQPEPTIIFATQAPEFIQPTQTQEPTAVLSPTPEAAIINFPPDTVFGGEVLGYSGEGPKQPILEDMWRRGYYMKPGDDWCYVVQETNGAIHMYPDKASFENDYNNWNRIVINGDEAYAEPDGSCNPPYPHRE